MHVTPRSIALLFVAILAGFATFAVLHDARRTLGWFFAAFVVAVLVTGPVEWLQRRMRRAIAVTVVFLVLGGVVGFVASAVFRDLANQLDRLEVELPAAAQELEDSERFGEVARDLELVDRAEQAVDDLGARLSGRARATAASFGAYLAGTVLVLFLLAWLPRLLDGGLRQIADEARRARTREVIDATLHTARRYLSGVVALAAASGLVAYVVARQASLPAPVALGLFIALFSVVPYLGVIVGAIPATLLSAGLESGRTTGLVIVALVGLQVAVAIVQQRLQRATLYVGPGITLVVGSLGYALYNVGGAMFGIAGAVFLLALADAVATDEPPPETLDALVIV